jgi:hypothetical protein
MRQSFGVRRSRDRLFTGSQPISSCGERQGRLSEVMGDEFRPRLCILGKLLHHYLRDTLVVLLTGAAQQRLIGGILDERMLERIGGLRRHPPLVHELSVY